MILRVCFAGSLQGKNNGFRQVLGQGGIGQAALGSVMAGLPIQHPFRKVHGAGRSPLPINRAQPKPGRQTPR